MPLYKGKGDTYECSNSGGIRLLILSVVGKLYGRVLSKGVRARTEFEIGGEQCGFRHGSSVRCKAGV